MMTSIEVLEDLFFDDAMIMDVRLLRVGFMMKHCGCGGLERGCRNLLRYTDVQSCRYVHRYANG